MGTEQVTKAAFSVQEESLDYFFINDPSMKEVLRRYTDLTGKPVRLAPWTYGLWLSTSFTTDYDEKTVMSFINGMEERGILQVYARPVGEEKGASGLFQELRGIEKVFLKPGEIQMVFVKLQGDLEGARIAVGSSSRDIRILL